MNAECDWLLWPCSESQLVSDIVGTHIALSRKVSKGESSQSAGCELSTGAWGDYTIWQKQQVLGCTQHYTASGTNHTLPLHSTLEHNSGLQRYSY